MFAPLGHIPDVDRGDSHHVLRIVFAEPVIEARSGEDLRALINRIRRSQLG